MVEIKLARVPFSSIAFCIVIPMTLHALTTKRTCKITDVIFSTFGSKQFCMIHNDAKHTY